VKRHHIIPVVILLAVIAGFGAVYQFYVKEQLEEYQANQKQLTELKNRVKSLEDTFKGVDGRPVKPQVAVQQLRSAVQPFKDAVQKRSKFFTLGKEAHVDLVPEGKDPRFYYMEALPKLIYETEQYAYARRCAMPQNLTFGVPSRKDITNVAPTEKEVNNWLKKYAFGSSVVHMLVDAGATRIDNIVLWPSRTEFQLLDMRTVGLQFQMSLDNLARFLKSFYGEDRYFNINSIRITNTNLLSRSQPQLEVEMVLTQAGFLEENAKEGKGSTPVKTASGGGGKAELTSNADKMLKRLKLRGGINLGGKGGKSRPRAGGRSWWQKYLPF